MNPQNLDAPLAKRSFHIRTINSSVLAKYVYCRGRPCRDEDVRVCQRCDMCWLMGVVARAERWRNDGVECSSDRPGRVVWLGEQMAAFPRTKIAKPTRCNRTKAEVGRFEPRFPYHRCDLSVSAHALIRMPATRCRTLRTGASRAGGGNRVAASVRGQSAVERLHCCDHGKLHQRLAIFPGLAITVTRLGVARKSG